MECLLDSLAFFWMIGTSYGHTKLLELRNLLTFFRGGDRPLFPIVYQIIIPIIKDSPLSWQIFAIFTKWLAAISLWALLKLLLPKRDSLHMQ